MFSVESRERIRRELIERARSDPRIVAAAAVGSSAGRGDRWSDLDLTFGVAEEVTVESALTDWTKHMIAEYGAAVLFDLPRDSSIYRVFLLPGMLQIDLSFTPAAQFGARGPRFHLLFGEAVEHPPSSPLSPHHLFGLGIHHVVRAHFCIERGRLCQAEYWIHQAYDLALILACLRLGLEASEGRGYDSLPPEVRESLADALVGRLTVEELRRANASAAAGLLREAEHIPGVTTSARSIVQELF